MAKWETARVFISSTFRDMHAERDHLVKVVFPELRERLLPYRVYLDDIDLRWGITEEESKKDRVLDLCLQQIDECRPFFIGILGERYGWVPTTPLSREAAKRFEKYGKTQFETGQSVTELEILFGVLLMDPRMKGRSFFYFRDPRFLNTVAAHRRREVRYQFQEFPSQEEVQQLGYKQARREAAMRRLKLRRLKHKIRAVREHGYPVFENYKGRWNPTAFDRATKTHGRLVDLDDLGRQIRDQLWEAIKGEFQLPDQAPAPAGLDEAARLAAEADDQARFVESRLRVYVGREDVQRELVAYTVGNEPKPCLVTGPSGSGKSAALARFVDRAAEDLPGVQVISHFVGASPRSTALRDMLKRLCTELYEKPFITEQQIKQEFARSDGIARLATLWREVLNKITKGHRVVIVLDALNQLEEGDRARELWWLPRDLLPHVKIVASCIVAPNSVEANQDPIAGAFRNRPHHPVGVGALRVRDALTIVRRVPSLSAKTLDRRQRRRLLEKPATANPLYLRVALEELRGFGSFEELGDRIAALPQEGLPEEVYRKAGFSHNAMRVAGDPLTALFVQMIQRLRNEFKPKVARAVLTLLATARRGLSDRELLGLIEGPDVTLDASGSDLFPILRQLRSYLVNRGGMMGFFHGDLLRAVESYYLPKEGYRRTSHSRLADYFAKRADVGRDGSWRGDDARALTELPFHRSHALADALTLMTDIRYVEARTRLTDVQELVGDYERYAPHGAADAWRDLIRRHAQRLASHRGAFFSLAYHDGPSSVRESARRLVRDGLWGRAWIRPEAAWLPERSDPDRRESVAVRAAYAFDYSSATDLADDRGVAFYVARLGEVKLVDLDRFVELPTTLSVRRGRPLRLAVSPDARGLALAYDDGWAEIYRLDLADDGAVLAQSLVETVTYLVPESEPPVLAWDGGTFWYQPDPASIGRLDLDTDPPSSDLIALPARAHGELSGWVAQTGGHVVTLRQPGRTTAVVVLGAGGAVEALRLPGVDVTAACSCGDQGIALVSASRTIEVYRLAPGWTRAASAESAQAPACLVWDGTTLAWICEDAHFHRWDPSGTSSPQDLGRFPDVFPSNRRVTPRRVCARPDGSYVAVTGSEVFRFAITSGSNPEAYTLKLVLQGPDGAPHAVQERDNEDWLLDLTARTERRLESFDEFRLLPFLCAINGAGRLLAASTTGAAHLVDLASGKALTPIATPAGVAAVVGDLEFGFWLVDRAGTIYTTMEGNCTRAAALGLDGPGGAQLRCGLGVLVWRGTCYHAARWGTDFSDAVVVFRLRGGRADRLGERFFEKSDGTVRALDLSPDGRLVVAVLEHSSRSAASLRVGTPEDFVRCRDVERVLTGTDPDVLRARVQSDGLAVDLLCTSGTLFRVDITTGQVRAVLSLSEPLTELAVGPTRGPELLLAQAKARPLTCHFEEND
ncbi:MAG: DUF4062 domain-containing protein [Isosphaerales bacterium]